MSNSNEIVEEYRETDIGTQAQERHWGNGALSFSCFSGTPPYDMFPVERTSAVDEVLICKTRAKVRYAFNDGHEAETYIAPNEFSFMPPGATVRAMFETRPTSIVVSLPETLRKRFENEHTAHRFPDEPLPFSGGLTNARSYLALVEDFLNSGGLGGTIRAESITSLLISDLYQSHNAVRDTPCDNKLSQSQMARITEYIDAHIDEKIDLETLSDLAEVSPFHFTRLFKETTGLPPYQFVIQHRISKAQALLRSTQISLAEVSYACGFSSQSHMSVTFRKIVGTTPSAFRKLTV